MEDEFKLEDLLIIIRRRFLYFLIPVAVFVPLLLLGVFLIPAKYTAQGTILIESQQIPEELVRSTNNSYAQERIQVIQQRVMTRNRLLEVADKYQLFPSSARLSESQRVEKMRGSLGVKLISTNERDRRRQQDGTIAFTVAYEHNDATKAYQVANEFITLFLAEDVRTRAIGASTTTAFFEQETRRLRNTVDELESRIAGFKSENAEALPEHLNMHIQQLSRTTSELSDAQNSMMLLEEEMRSLEMQLASYLSGASTSNGPAEELNRLRAQLAAMRADKTDAHPDVAALRDQIASLQQQMKPSRSIQKIRTELDEAEQALREARNEAPQDPEKIEALVAEARQIRERLRTQLNKETMGLSSDFNVTLIQGRIDIAQNRLNALEARDTVLREEIAGLEDRIARTPAVERGLATLTRDYQNVFSEYQQIQAKQQAAIIAENLEEDQKSEKFSILEPAVKPDQPSSPDRPKLSVMSIFVAGAIGAACALLAELMMATVRGREHITSMMGEPPIAIIPYIQNEDDRKIRVPKLKRAGKPDRPTSGLDATDGAAA
ncbi:MAG: hypothetical protein AAFR21_01350 [Pseudomonadota bacterium]